jgi:hypothetical protein
MRHRARGARACRQELELISVVTNGHNAITVGSMERAVDVAGLLNCAAWMISGPCRT